MMEKMIALQQKRRSKKGGFTLVELIVVLVILAILAALLIPALTGYIDKAKEKSLVAETRQVVMAAQTLYDEYYGTLATNATPVTAPAHTGAGNFTKAKIAELAEVDKDNITTITVSNNKIATVVYERNNRVCTYTQSTGQYNVTKKS